MKVLCINNKNPENPQKISLSEYVFEGEIYTVVEASFINGKEYYQLAERYRGNKSVKYQAVRFIPLSDIDERTLAEKRKLELINPDK